MLAFFTVMPNLEGTFRLGKNPTSLRLIKDHCVESYFFFVFLFLHCKSICHCMCTSTGLSLRFYSEILLMLSINYPEFRRYHHTSNENNFLISQRPKVEILGKIDFPYLSPFTCDLQFFISNVVSNAK